MSSWDSMEHMAMISDTSEISQSWASDLQQAYMVSIHAILWYYENTMEWWRFFIIETANLATQSIADAFRHRWDQWVKDTDIKIDTWFPQYILTDIERDNPEVVYLQYLEQLRKLCEHCKNESRTLILWFSSMGWYELLPRISMVIKQLKSEFKDLICVIGWSDFNALPEWEFLDRVFEYGIDIVNIWWAGEFVDFFWTLSTTDIIYRDDNEQLRIRTDRYVPDNLIFSHQKDKIGEVLAWKKINTTSYYDDLHRALHFSINNNPCLNNCGYCANHIHASIPLTHIDIVNAIQDCNAYISQVEDDVFSLMIDNPNPTQYVDKFEHFLGNLDLTKVREIWFFGDFMGMGNKRTFDRIIKIIDTLLQRWPNLHITIHFWIDALHHKNDGEFIGRTVWLKIAEEPKYRSGISSFEKFIQRYDDNPRVHTPFNMIYHPNMELADYEERQKFISQYNQNSQVLQYTLVPHPNTQIEKTHQWYYIPESEIISIVDLLRPEFQNLNYWWYFYRNSFLLDCFVFSKQVWLDKIFQGITGSQFTIEDMNEFKEQIFFSFLKWCQQQSKNLLRNANSIAWRIKFRKRRETIKQIILRVDFTLRYIDFALYRENYITKINPSYQTKQLDDFLQGLGVYRQKFIELRTSIPQEHTA